MHKAFKLLPELSPGMQPMKWLRQLKGRAPAAACERLRKVSAIVKAHNDFKKPRVCGPLFNVMAAWIIQC